MISSSDGVPSTASPLRHSDPRTIGGFTLLGRLGAGGQGVVYLGCDDEGILAAIKLLHSHGDLSSQRAMAKELSAARRVAAFCTARVLASGMEGEDCYLVTEYVEGPNLLRVVRDNGPLAADELDRLAVGTATALAAIHQAGIVHRDLKPGNVLLAADGPRVIDFGISKALDTATGVTSDVVGTPAYMAPEQLAGRSGGAAADVFAWASLTVFAATGRPPFGDDSIPAVITRVLQEPPRLDGVPEHLRDTLTACLDKNPENRPDAPGLLRALLDRTGLAVPASEPDHVAHDATVILSEGAAVAATLALPLLQVTPTAVQVSRRPTARRAVVASAAVLLVIGVIGGAFWVRGLRSQDTAAVAASPPAARKTLAAPAAGSTRTTRGDASAEAVSASAMKAMSRARTASFELSNQQTEGEYQLHATGDLSFDGSASTSYQMSLDKGCAQVPVSATLIGNTGYSSLPGDQAAFDASPKGSYPGEDGCLSGIVQVRWASTPYNVATLLRAGHVITQTHGQDGLVLRGTAATSDLVAGNPAARLFSAYANAPSVVFRIELGADYLPRQVEFHFAISVDSGDRLDAAFTTTYNQWGMAPPVRSPS
ncbi:serine/threonine protein kinase [Actinomadura harenae]|uniref:serine/threonine protein kinase n=1 Tax=Actinomadura harenae TaxID=2483351 RepID=UPI0013157D7D|nr:serine/threonine-protein kinase [Actinomadura harenae]